MDGTTDNDRQGQSLVFRFAPWTVLILSYLALAGISRLFLFPDTNAPMLWLNSGFAAALLLRYGVRVWPLIALAAVLSALFITGPLFSATLVWTVVLTAGLMAVHALEPRLLLMLIDHAGTGGRRMLRHYPAFLISMGLIALGIVIAALPLSVIFHHHTPEALSPAQWLLLTWNSHLLGAFLALPLVLGNWRFQWLQGSAHRLIEPALWTAAFTATALIIQYQQLIAVYLTLPLMIWAATRFQLQGSVIAIALCSVTSLAILAHQGAAMPTQDLLLFQTLIMMMAGVSLYIRILLEDRLRIEVGLEHKVSERTWELQQKNQELEDEIYVREQAERSFRRSSRHYRALMETASNPIIVLDSDLHIRQWNSAAENLFGYSRDDVMDQGLMAFIPTPYQDEMAWKITKIQNTGLPGDSIEVPVKDFSGDRHTILWNINRLDDEDETVESSLILIGQDISEIRATQHRLHFLAHYDMLTGAANRRLFEDRCKQAMARALRHGHSCSLIALDVDHFKRINDTLGHEAGDALLKQMAERLRQCIRGEDTVARLGGDEFAVLLDDVNGAEGSEKVARNILSRLTEPVTVPGGELVITSSLGITVAPEDGSSYETLLKNADMAMYRAKRNGRNNIQFFSHAMNEEIQKQLRVERELGEAIQQGDMELWYQPVVDLNSGRIMALEALLRWHHRRDGLVSPAAFIEIAEQTGQLLQIGRWIYHNACLQARAAEAMHNRPTPVSINLSPRQYHHPLLAEALQEIIEQTGIQPSLLCLEVDEHILAQRPDDAITILERLRNLGISLILDQFGRGLSSVRLLRDLPFDQVKLDRSLLADVPNDGSSNAIIRTLVELAREMNLGVIASGVETDEQLRYLQSIQCQLVQGHRFCAPVPSSQLAELFSATRAGHSFHAGIQFDLLNHTEKNSDKEHS